MGIDAWVKVGVIFRIIKYPMTPHRFFLVSLDPAMYTPLMVDCYIYSYFWIFDDPGVDTRLWDPYRRCQIRALLPSWRLIVVFSKSYDPDIAARLSDPSRRRWIQALPPRWRLIVACSKSNDPDIATVLSDPSRHCWNRTMLNRWRLIVVYWTTIVSPREKTITQTNSSTLSSSFKLICMDRKLYGSFAHPTPTLPTAIMMKTTSDTDHTMVSPMETSLSTPSHTATPSDQHTWSP